MEYLIHLKLKINQQHLKLLLVSQQYLTMLEKLVNLKVNNLLLLMENQKTNNLENKKNQKINNLENKVNQKINNLQNKVNQKINNLENKKNQKTNNLQNKVNQKINNLQNKVNQKIIITIIINQILNHVLVIFHLIKMKSLKH